jgi:acyl dehydratase
VIPGVDYRQRHFEQVRAGDRLARVEDPITYRRVIMNSAASWDYFPGHHDPEYARAQGLPTIYVNTLHFLGFIDRLATDWGGPASFVVRRKVRMRRPLFAGDTMVGDGRVVRPYEEERAGRTRHLVELEITVCNQHGELCVPAEVHLALPEGGPPPA